MHFISTWWHWLERGFRREDKGTSNTACLFKFGFCTQSPDRVKFFLNFHYRPLNVNNSVFFTLPFISSNTPPNLNMSQHLEDLISNNDCPSDSVLQEVKNLLADPWKQLAETNAEIAILSPIRRVPPDILSTIFDQCLTTHRNPTISASECPMLLTRVCSAWRTLAIASPRLWTRIHIPFMDISLHGGNAITTFAECPPIPTQNVLDVLQLRCHSVGEWLARSGDCFLSISMCYYWSGNWRYPMVQQNDCLTPSWGHHAILLASERFGVDYSLESVL